ncbi:hypothetical protein [Halopiger goleimassiliensis]|uniref:hypothetical protein n=1 Tax=Halopiger goleimassiliensis TaxID=1293048 RepID=UPI000677B280|nr:hypothetical protein [Halopiger goleimassiliensis]
MSAERESDPKTVVTVVLVAFTAVGIVGAGQTADAGTAVTWLWMGIGLSVTYLLYEIRLALERIAAGH